MDTGRIKRYESLGEIIGNTPLVQFDKEVPNGNRIWIKRECDAPFGSHYDRVYLALFRHFEEQGKIKPGDRVFETSSGTAAASYAGIGRELGFECHVAVPEGVDQAVIDVIRERGAVIYFTPEKDYVAGFPKFLKEFRPWDRGFTFLNHSMDRKGSAYINNEITLDALAGIAEEAVAEIQVDYFVPAVGNGSSILGPGRVFNENTRVVAFESFQSAVLFDKINPGEYQKRFGIEPGTLPRHKLRGTSYPGIDFPHINTIVRDGIVDEIVLLSDAEVDENYFRETGRRDSEQFLHWDSIRYKDLGRTGRAGIVVALDITRRVSDKNFLVMAYDTEKNYDF